jgi:myo-inositol-1-phosphate synthase
MSLSPHARTAPAPDRLGVWLIGTRGSVATTTVLGALAIRSGLAGSTGLIGSLSEIAPAGLPDLDRLVFGGHDISAEPLTKRAEALARQGVVPAVLPTALDQELQDLERRLRPGIDARSDEPQARAIERVTADLIAFRAEHQLARVVVVDVSSTEPPVAIEPGPLTDIHQLEAALAAGQAPLPPSSAYVLAAYRAGCSVVSFTPSPGPRLPVLVELAARLRLPWAGSDGKTGETLLKSALAPMFATRALDVRSWASYNMLGGGDGATLADPEAAASKIVSKNRGLETMLGHPVDGPMHIDYVPSLGDWKTALDHVTFEGFLGTRMSVQITWNGCDSALAAPLVLDLARLLLRAHEAGRHGPQTALGFFFKDPAGSDEHRLSEQWRALVDWCRELGELAGDE